MEPSRGQTLELEVSEFVALFNQTVETAWNGVVVRGELANLRVSKGKWLYFDLKDEYSTVKFFGTVYHLPGPLEDGMILKVRGTPRLHNQYGFSVNVQTIQPAGEGTIRRAAELLRAKLKAEGLFAAERKRSLPYPPQRIGLITSKQSAAYADFIKVVSARWSGLVIDLLDVQVQGDLAPAQILAAIRQFNALANPPEVIVIIRGGGSAEDLAAFSTEQVARAVAASRVPTLVAIGHEIDLSLAELAADLRASTPSNAAELLVPDKAVIRARLYDYMTQLQRAGQLLLDNAHNSLNTQRELLDQTIEQLFVNQRQQLVSSKQLLAAFNPEAILRRGYAVVRQASRTVHSGSELKIGAAIQIELADARIAAKVTDITKNRGKRRDE